MAWHNHSGAGNRSAAASRMWAKAAMVLSLLASSAGAREAAEDIVRHGDPSNSSEQVVSRGLEDGTHASLEPEDRLAHLSLEELMQVQVVVTAARREQEISTVPHAISVITAADLRASGIRSVPDALRLVPGVDVAELSFGHAAVSPRGFHGFLANQVLVLVDGRQIFDSLFGGTTWGAWPFLLENIERIEVIRGPGGVTWGANAVNGVINIITKNPDDQLGFTLTSSGGSRGTFKQHLGYGLREDELYMRISAEYEASDGFEDGSSLLRRLEDDKKSGRFSLHAVYDQDE